MTTVVAADPRDDLARLGRSAVAAGLVVGSGGNLSVRVPGTDACWVTGTGTWLDRLDRDSFSRVELAGDPAHRPPADPAAAPPTSELALHLAVYRVRPEVRVVVHLHPQTVLLLDALGEEIRLATTDHAYYLRRVVTVPFHPPGTRALADAVAGAASDGADCLVLARHGCSVLADTVELAHKRALYLEEAARLTYRALLLGGAERLTRVPPGFAAYAAGADTI